MGRPSRQLREQYFADAQFTSDWELRNANGLTGAKAEVWDSGP